MKPGMEYSAAIDSIYSTGFMGNSSSKMSQTSCSNSLRPETDRPKSASTMIIILLDQSGN